MSSAMYDHVRQDGLIYLALDFFQSLLWSFDKALVAISFGVEFVMVIIQAWGGVFIFMSQVCQPIEFALRYAEPVCQISCCMQRRELSTDQG